MDTIIVLRQQRDQAETIARELSQRADTLLQALFAWEETAGRYTAYVDQLDSALQKASAGLVELHMSEWQTANRDFESWNQSAAMLKALRAEVLNVLGSISAEDLLRSLGVVRKITSEGPQGG